jgi:Putative metallopeptidase
MAEVRLHLTITTAFAIITALVAFCGAVSAQTPLETRIAAGVGKIRAACGDDIKKYCSTVTPGDSRLILCIQAHEDQISVQCDYALFEASRNLERALDRIGQIADVCWTDIAQFCSHLPEGGRWRIPQCLASQKVVLSPACQGAISPAAAQDVRPQRVKIEVYPPKTPDLQEAYDVLIRSRWMDEAQEFFGIFKLPQDITIFVRSCGMSNAWYVHGTLTVCYEYLDDIIKSIPPGDTPDGITPRDAARGQFVYTLTHEMGHALYDILEIPILGAPEDAADDFAAYMMLQLGKERSRQLMLGAAYSYANYIKNPKVTVNLGAFADVHSAPMQRYYDLLCMAYGANHEAFQDVVEKGYLPAARAKTCSTEYGEVNFAFKKLIQPSIDEELAKKVLDRAWLPDPNIRLFGGGETATPSPTPDPAK